MKVTWDAPGTRYFETGADRGMLYVPSQGGVPWNGLVSVNVDPSGGSPSPLYLDGVKYANLRANVEFEATIEALSFPNEFNACQGMVSLAKGLLVSGQKILPFNFSFRSGIGDDLSQDSGLYKLHLIYEATADPLSANYATQKQDVDPMKKSIKISTIPPYASSQYKRTSYFVVDSRVSDSDALDSLEDILYGTDDTAPRFPTVSELLALFS